MEYSTISKLDYFKDNLSNVGLTESLTEWDSNDVTRV